MLEKDHRKAVLDYLSWRVEKRKRISDNDEYLGLRPDSPLLLAKGNAGFTPKNVEYVKTDKSIAVYKVCSSLQQLLSDLVKRVNQTGSSHSGRRTYNSRLAERGIDIEFIQYFPGYKSKQQTIDCIDADPKKGRMILKNVYGEF